MISSVIKLDVNLSIAPRTGTLTRFGVAVNYYDLAVSGITDHTKCVIIPSENITQGYGGDYSYWNQQYGATGGGSYYYQLTGTGFLLGASVTYNIAKGGTIELISNSVLRFITTAGSGWTGVTAKGRLQIVQFK